MAEIRELIEIMAQLRHPQSGCDWDVKQTFQSIAPFTIEEAYEVADAIDREDMVDLQDELGDLLLQVIFHSRMAEEAALFNFADVTQSIIDKMVRRHPHVFGEAGDPDKKPNYPSTEALKKAWEQQKSAERAKKSSHVDSALPVSELDGVAINLPALIRAAKIQKRAARVGFDWPDSKGVMQKVDEEMAEIRSAMAAGCASAIEDEIGDLLFTAVNLARHNDVDPELALKKANAKFSMRFRSMEARALDSGQPLAGLLPDELEEAWTQAKLDTEKE